MLFVYLYFVIFCCFFNFSLQKHFIAILLSLEFILVIIFMMLIFKELYLLSLIIISLGACEGALGLSLLIRLSRIKNEFFLNRFNISKC